MTSKGSKEHFQLLYRVGIALSAESNKDRLIETILIEAKDLCNADAGTIYLRTDDDCLRFAIMRTDSLGIALGGTTGKAIPLQPIRLYDKQTGEPNHTNIASHVAIEKKTVNIADAYCAQGFDFSGMKKFDESNGYRSQSVLAIPMVNNKGDVIGVLQLLNAKDPGSSQTVAFDDELTKIVGALASQAAIALDNQQLLDGQKTLLESFIKLIAAAIDAKSPYTGGHCERVPILTEMLAKVACDCQEGPFGAFDLSDEEWYELHIAAWLHDCGKVVTPVHVMDKATKLECIFDRIELVRERFEVFKRDAEIRYLRKLAEGAESPAALKAQWDAETESLESDLALLERSNRGGEYLEPEVSAQLRRIGARTYERDGKQVPLLNEEELENILIAKGTLTERERLVINGHMVQTIKMLEALPFPRNLRRVPEYAGGHHEKMDGQGYPKGLWAGDMSIPARIMAIADVFEALTATDRPYKSGKTLSETISIMGAMKRHNHLDPQLLDLFVRSGVYIAYATAYLPAELIDDVDEERFLAIEPLPFEAPDKALRDERWQDFLPEYRQLPDLQAPGC